MELWIFLGATVIVLLFLARGRLGGRAESPAERLSREEGRPINYGNAVSPRGTAAGASANAFWFKRDHTHDGTGDGRPGSSQSTEDF